MLIPPEALDKITSGEIDKYVPTKAGDMWQLGVTLVSMIYGSPRRGRSKSSCSSSSSSSESSAEKSKEKKNKDKKREERKERKEG